VLSTNHYALTNFSTGQLLDDDYSLAWYRLRPNELLELHPPGIVINLPRDNIFEYSQPYFEAKIKALRVTIGEQSAMDKDCDADGRTPAAKHKADGPTKKGKEKETPDTVSSVDRPSTSKKRKKTQLEWKERWLIIHQGGMNVYKDRFVGILIRSSRCRVNVGDTGFKDINPIYSSHLSALCSLRDGEDAFHEALGSVPSPHMVGVKFRTLEQFTSGEEDGNGCSHEGTGSIGNDAWLNPWTGATIPQESEDIGGSLSGLFGRRGSKEDMAKLRKGSNGSIRRGEKTANENLACNDSFLADFGVGNETEGSWLIFDMLDKTCECFSLKES